MKIPVQVTFRDIEPSETIKDWVQEETDKLDMLYPQIMGCRVAVGIPHRHRQRGQVYGVRVDLTLPGGEIISKRAPILSNGPGLAGKSKKAKQWEVDTSHKSLRLAISDAFKSASRRLQDFARRRRQDVKTHEPPALARVSELFPDRGFGFLTAPDGREIYFHENSVLNRAFRRLRPGTAVSFVEEQGEKGPQASTVRIFHKRSTRRPAAGSAAPAPA